MTCRLAPLALSALCALLPGAARADARATIRLDGFGWSLIDLSPGDGVAPWVRFDTQAFNSLGTFRVWSRMAGQPLPPPTVLYEPWRMPPGQGFFTGQLHEVQTIGAEVNLHQSGAVSQHGFDLRLEGVASDTSGDPVAASNFQGSAVPAGAALPGSPGSGQRVPIELGPHSRLLWTGTLTLEVERTGLGSPQGTPSPREGAFASAYLGLTDSLGQVSEIARWVGTGTGQPQRHVEALSLSMDNTGSGTLQGTLGSYLNLFGRAIVDPAAAPAPEPATWALLAGGLGVTGVAAARRRARHA